MRAFARAESQPQQSAEPAPVPPHAATSGPGHREPGILRVQRTAGNRAVQRLLRAHRDGSVPALTQVVQRQPGAKAPATATAKAAPSKAPVQKGLNRTLYVIQNDIWNELPAAVRAGAEQELKTLFAFVGAAGGEKPFSIKVISAAQLPEQFDFSESVVTLIRGDTDSYVKAAFARQNEQIRRWLAQQKVTLPPQVAGGKDPFNPERIGTGGGSKTTRTEHGQTYALIVMAGAVDIDQVIDSFLENVETLLAEQLEQLDKRGRDPAKWPQTVTSKGGTTSWQPLPMLGSALAHAIAHEARHEYIAAHASTGLGQDSPFIIGEKTTAQFSKADQKAILDRIHQLETTQGKATVVPTYPEGMRKEPGQFPF